jgi:DNA-binding response OmpR family regulator
MREDKVAGTAVLIISYNYVLRDILTRMLTTRGYRVVNRSVGLHGLRTFKKMRGKFDIVFIDSELPDMSSLSVAKKIKEINRSTSTILVRGWEGGPEEQELRGVGVDKAINRPLFMDKTYELIENAVASIQT